MSHKEFRDLATPEEAHDAIAGLDLSAGTETVSLRSARGRVLAERVDATIDVPGFDRAAMDGYAVRARDTFGADADPTDLALVGAVHAGAEPDVEVGDGEAAEVSTGAVMPPGADAVVIVERTETDGETVTVRDAVTPGENVMPAGADIAAGTRALGPGTRLTAREIGLLAALGRDAVTVRAAPQVGIVSTGDELVRPGDDLSPEAGQIYDVNSDAVATAVAEAGGDPVLYPHAGDDYDELEATLREAAAECDLVLSSGSTSASAVDVVYRVVEEQGELLLHGVAVKPGKPMLVGRLEDSAYVGLPGYPVSALTIFRTFVAPAIRDAAGLPEPRTATVSGRMAVRERAEEGRHRLVPVGLVEDGDGETLVYPVDKGSGATTSLVDADGTVEIDADTAYLDAGEQVEVHLFSPDVRVPTLLVVGEDDPTLWDVLDALDAPRYLPAGSEGGCRSLRDGVADVAAVSGPVDCEVPHEELGGWEREWGLVVPAGNPDGVAGLDDVLVEDCRFVARESGSGLRASLEARAADVAAARDATVSDLLSAVPTRSAHESPARLVARGAADAGLGLRSTAANLDLEFVGLGTESVRLLANPDRIDKTGVGELSSVLADLDVTRSGASRGR